MLALRTPTLPPATTTNTVLLGTKRIHVVDPATPWEDERRRLLGALDDEAGAGGRVESIVLTHHHADHVGAAGWLRERLGVPVLATARTKELLEGRLAIDGLLREGDEVRGSDAPEERWEVLETPGHASGHLVLWQPETRGLVAGDMVASEGTIVVEPPDGHMATYVAQLGRLASLAPAWLVPAHGEIVTDPVALLRHYVAHRLMRERLVLGALAEGPAALAEVTRRSYRDKPASILPLAERACLAHLGKLEEEGRALRRPDGTWSAEG